VVTIQENMATVTQFEVHINTYLFFIFFPNFLSHQKVFINNLTHDAMKFVVAISISVAMKQRIVERRKGQKPRETQTKIMLLFYPALRIQRVLLHSLPTRARQTHV
jgi:membrane-associated PAP2 superfamily phosphatase